MKNENFALILIPPTGGAVQRLSLSRYKLYTLLVILSSIILFISTSSVYALFLTKRAKESLALRQENQKLNKLTADLEKRLPLANNLAFRSEQTFKQLWAKSGLGLGVNEDIFAPETKNDQENPEQPPTDANDKNFNLHQECSAEILSLNPEVLPLKFNQFENDNLILQNLLAEMLEYFHDTEHLLSNTPSIKPVRTLWLSSNFGKRRDPINGHWVMHKGLDLAGPLGTDVIAPADGLVIWTGIRGGYGKTIVIDHGYGLQTHFAHLKDFSIRINDHVKRGDLIGKTGNTGRSTGPHLHYEVRKNGRPLNPANYILN